MKHIFSLLMCIFMTALFQPLSAADNQKFPDSLFGVKLGGVYNIGKEDVHKEVGNMPVKKSTGMYQFLGNGFHYYFEPLKEYKAFRYVERPEKPDDELFKTSFSVYLLPVIPEKVKRFKELESIQPKWEVTRIVWEDTPERTAEETEAYFWAIDLCKTVGADLDKEPKIADYYEMKWYKCSFEEGLKQIEIEGLPEIKIFSLSYTSTESKRKQETVEVLLRKLRMKEMKPY